MDAALFTTQMASSVSSPDECSPTGRQMSLRNPSAALHITPNLPFLSDVHSHRHEMSVGLLNNVAYYRVCVTSSQCIAACVMVRHYKVKPSTTGSCIC